MALHANNSVHQATDNMGYMARAPGIPDGLTIPSRDHGAFKEMATVWALFVENIRITKVKGHATDHMVEQGLVNKRDKDEHEEADRAAEE